MRNFFLVVLVANLAVFLYYFYAPSNNGGVSAPLPANINQLVLLSEVDKSTLTVESKPEEMVLSEEAAVVAVKSAPVKKEPLVSKCYTIGPFREESDIKHFESQVRSKVAKTGIRQRTEKQHWRYWVYLDNAGSKAKAVKLASELARKGLKDYYVIARGENRNSISLGHFKDKALAEKRLKAIKAMSFKPQMKAVEKEYTLYWLDYTARKQEGLSQLTLDSFELEEGVLQFNRDCKK